MQKPIRMPPRRALWEITWKCDLRCKHCLVEGGEPASPELSPTACLDLADQLADMRVPIVSLTGGEPFLRNDWREIAERVRHRGMRLRFSSNGHLLNESRLRDLVELGVESFSVSLDGMQPTHDAIRSGPTGSPPSFARVIEAIRLLHTTEILATVRTTIVRENLSELPAMHEFLKGLGVRRWILQLAHRTGRLREENNGGAPHPIEPEQLGQVADFIVARAADRQLPPRAFNSIGYLSKQEPILRQSGRREKNPVWRGCQCGITVMGIEPDGGIKGCANQVGKPFVVGHVPAEPLREIWNDEKRWFWLHPTVAQMTGECAGCALGAVCTAGCTAMAYRSTGHLFNNPYCLRRQEKQSGELPQ